MINLKCPFCQQELQEDVGYDGDYSCPNCREPYFGSPELWQELIKLMEKNKDLSDKIGKQETELEKTHKELEQSETCCTEWEKQALDYKAENIALSGDLERICKALGVAVDKLKGIKTYYDDSYADPHFVNWHIVAQRLANDADDAIKAITALEQKDVK